MRGEMRGKEERKKEGLNMKREEREKNMRKNIGKEKGASLETRHEREVREERRGEGGGGRKGETVLNATIRRYPRTSSSTHSSLYLFLFIVIYSRNK